MKNSFKHFIKHLECKLYINPKTQNYNLNMQTFKQHNNIITSIHNTLDVIIDSFFTKKKSKFKLPLKLKLYKNKQIYQLKCMLIALEITYVIFCQRNFDDFNKF